MRDKIIPIIAIGSGVAGVIGAGLTYNWEAMGWAMCAIIWMVVSILQSISIADLRKVVRHYNENRI